jgi:multidrug transporter EmrE-like cation transporter
MKSRHFNFNILGGILVYFASSLGGIAIVKFLNYRFCFTSWLLLALLSRATWLLSLVLHITLQCFDKFKSSLPILQVSCYQLRLYLLIAIGLSVVELFNALSMSMLPGSLYMLLKGSDVGWSMALSYYLLDKRYSRKEVFAAMLIMTGVAMVFLLNDAPTDSSYSPDVDIDIENASYYPVTLSSAAALCLCGAFLNALCAVGTEATLKRTLREEEHRLQEVELLEQPPSTQAPPSKLLLSNAYSMWTSFFSFSLLLVPVSISFHGNGNGNGSIG